MKKCFTVFKYSGDFLKYLSYTVLRIKLHSYYKIHPYIFLTVCADLLMIN